MPRIIHCPDCGISLNVPDAAVGRRLKCPRCGTKFESDGTRTAQLPPSPSTGTKGDLNRSGSVMIPSPSGRGDFDMPKTSGSLREMFDLPAGTEEGQTSHLPTSAAPIADPFALLKDDAPSRRRQTAAEGRARARRCPTCGGVVPLGMSLCGTCGLDLETGARIDLAESIDTISGPRRPSGLPIGVWVVGMISMGLSVIFTIISLIKWQKGETGFVFLLLVCVFGAYAAAQFLRSKSVKLLFIALSLGAMIDVVALMILPIYHASIQVDVREKKVDPDSPDDADIAITNISERLDTSSLSWGIGILVSYALVSLYLNSPSVRRYFQ